ncbi:MAG TPA: hypothetical protein VHZ03_41120 [Trebonia sp.]|jgi:hypothetical protein|nr:hypothetical protein [Trebonia sp.]
MTVGDLVIPQLIWPVTALSSIQVRQAGRSLNEMSQSLGVDRKTIRK